MEYGWNAYSRGRVCSSEIIIIVIMIMILGNKQMKCHQILYN